MIAWLVGFALKAGIPAKAAKPLVIAALVIALCALMGGAKCAYDSRIIENHENKIGIQNERADRKADNKAGDERVADKTRIQDEGRQIDEAIEQAEREGRDARAAYYHCVELQQAARRAGKPSPDC